MAVGSLEGHIPRLFAPSGGFLQSFSLPVCGEYPADGTRAQVYTHPLQSSMDAERPKFWILLKLSYLVHRPKIYLMHALRTPFWLVSETLLSLPALQFGSALSYPVYSGAVYLQMPGDALICPSLIVQRHHGVATVSVVFHLMVRGEALYGFSGNGEWRFSSKTAFTVWPSGLRPKSLAQMLAISSKLRGGCSRLRSMIVLRMFGGSTWRLAFGESKRAQHVLILESGKSPVECPFPRLQSLPHVRGPGYRRAPTASVCSYLLCASEVHRSSSCSQPIFSVESTRSVFRFAIIPPPENVIWGGNNAMSCGLRLVRRFLLFRAFSACKRVLPSLAPPIRCTIFG